MMKTIKLYFSILATLLVLTACGGGGSDEPAGPETYQRSVSIGYQATEDVYTLPEIAQIVSIQGTTDWLSVTQPNANTVRVVVQENLKLTVRTTTLVVTAQNGDKVNIYVSQEAHPEEPNKGADDSHDSETDQPAYAPVR